MADDALDELYWVKPEDFTATRTRLAAAAKERGEAAVAKEITASRRPTAAAWAVNRLVLSRGKARQRMTDLRERLRGAHAEMDGARIRELSAEQRKLIDELTAAALDAAELKNPSAALRDDIATTLQAAIADPSVGDRLGRLAKAESWSGFGDFGVAAPVSTATRAAKAKTKDKTAPAEKRSREEATEAEREYETAKAALATAERAKADAGTALDERQSELVSARWRHQEARKQLDKAERELNDAQDAHEKAKQADRDATDLVKQAKARLKDARG
jgi:hypothetical protein